MFVYVIRMLENHNSLAGRIHWLLDVGLPDKKILATGVTEGLGGQNDGMTDRKLRN